jgi:hypothetical protein
MARRETSFERETSSSTAELPLGLLVGRPFRMLILVSAISAVLKHIAKALEEY